MCWPWDVSCNAGEAADSVTNTIFEEMAKSVADAVGKVVGELVTLWVEVPTPTIDGGAANDIGDPVGESDVYQVLGHVTWVGLVVAAVSMVFLGIMIATRVRRGEGFAAVGRAGLVLGGVILVGGASAIAARIIRVPESNGPSGFIQGSTLWILSALVVLSIIIGGAKMAWEQRAEPGRDLLKSLMTVIVVSGAALTVVGLLVSAGDAFSVGIIDASVEGGTAGLGAAMTGIVVTGGSTIGGFGGIPIAAIVVGLVILVVSFVQLVLMVARYAMLVVLAGVLPLSASFTNTEMGKTWMRKNVSWLLAFILYKPAVAIIYATAIRLTKEGVFGPKPDASIVDDVDPGAMVNTLAGLMLMVMGIIALPALMRFVTPAVGAIGGTAGGMAAGTMATGALDGGRLAGSRGDSGPHGAHGVGQSGPAGQAGASGSTGGAGSAGATAGAGAGAGAGGAGAGAGAGAGTGVEAGTEAGADAGAEAVLAGAVSGTAKAATDAAVGVAVSTAEGVHANG